MATPICGHLIGLKWRGISTRWTVPLFGPRGPGPQGRPPPWGYPTADGSGPLDRGCWLMLHLGPRPGECLLRKDRERSGRATGQEGSGTRRRASPLMPAGNDGEGGGSQWSRSPAAQSSRARVGATRGANSGCIMTIGEECSKSPSRKHTTWANEAEDRAPLVAQ